MGFPVKNYVKSLEPELVHFRRDFHKFAESGWEEIRTSSLIAKELEDLGYEIVIGEDLLDLDSRMGVPDKETLQKTYYRAISQGAIEKYAEKMRDGKTGVMGVFKNGDGPVVGMRFDIDALDLIEDTTDSHLPKVSGFSSINDNMMHACGHDGHATIGLGVAKTLMEFKENIKGTVKLIFQPAEEGVRGAKAIVEKGHLDDVDFFLASHITGNKNLEEIDLYPGSNGALATTKLDVTFKGLSSHAGGAPELGHNAAMGMATAILNLYAIPRHSKGVSRINVGYSQAGTGRNVIPDEAKLKIETRGATTEINDYVRNYAEDIIKSAAQMHKLEYEIEKVGEANSLESDDELADRIRRVSEELGLKVSDEDKMALGGSEDVSYMLNRVQEKGGQGSFVRILTKISAPAHNRKFDFDEEVLTKGVLIFSEVVFDIFKNN